MLPLLKLLLRAFADGRGYMIIFSGCDFASPKTALDETRWGAVGCLGPALERAGVSRPALGSIWVLHVCLLACQMASMIK